MRWFAVVLMTLMFAVPVKAQQGDIEGVISSQIESFQRDDFETAFTHAAPNIVALFQTPQRFAQMVVNGYPMVHRPTKVEFQDLVQRGGALYQRVLLRDRTGAYFQAEYSMVKVAGVWKIAGVQIVRAPGVGA
ncbi:MAG: DUF4864 domain-containing protein [Pseudomonadota bacterium]